MRCSAIKPHYSIFFGLRQPGRSPGPGGAAAPRSGGCSAFRCALGRGGSGGLPTAAFDENRVSILHRNGVKADITPQHSQQGDGTGRQGKGRPGGRTGIHSVEIEQRNDNGCGRAGASHRAESAEKRNLGLTDLRLDMEINIAPDLLGCYVRYFFAKAGPIKLLYLELLLPVLMGLLYFFQLDQQGIHGLACLLQQHPHEIGAKDKVEYKNGGLLAKKGVEWFGNPA